MQCARSMCCSIVHCVKKLGPILRRRAEYPQSSTRVIRAGTNTLSELRKHTEHTTYHGEHRNHTAVQICV